MNDLSTLSTLLTPESLFREVEPIGQMNGKKTSSNINNIVCFMSPSRYIDTYI